MNDIPGLRLAPMRMIALVGQRGHQLDSVAPTSTPTARHAAGSSDPRVLAATPLDVKERTTTNADTPPAKQTRVARFTSNHSERMGDAYDAPERDISFDEFLDIVNPLHHIPIVGTIYRAITGDEISPSASIFGGFLFGGPLGFVTAIASAIFEEANGQNLGDTVLAALVGDDTLPDVQTAQTTPSASSTTASLDRIRIDKVERIHAVDGIIEGDSNRPRSAPEIAAPTQDSQALAAATPTASTARSAGGSLGSSEDLTGQPALGAFVRDLQQSEQLARAALASVNPGVPVAIQARVPDARLLDPRPVAAGLPASALAERMSHALDKYQAMARKGERNGNDRAVVLDAEL